MSDYLCEELIDEILERLPSKSLHRIRSVSKSWDYRISSPNFIRKHAIRSITTTTYEYTRRELAKFTESDYRITGSCFRIICMGTRKYYNPSVILWNPSVRRKLTVPNYPSRHWYLANTRAEPSSNGFRRFMYGDHGPQKLCYGIGGLWVMFELPSANSKSKFLAHVGVGSWFKSLSNPQPDFSPRGRIIWVDVEGVPMHAWSSNTFHKIGSMWGEVLELGDCKDECFAPGRLNEVVDSARQSIPKENSYDPFNIYDILNKENKDVNAAATNSSIPFPPGFTPDKPDTDVDELVAQKDQFQPDVKSVGSSSHTVESANNVDGEYRKHTEKERKWFYLGDFGRDDIGRSNHGFLERIIDLRGADDHVR
ncbi:RNA-directed DNA polymerase, eukaryota [Tanacetum coccineum]